MSPPEFNRLDTETAYLVSLTRAGLKPLSRKEKPLDSEARRTIETLGLHVDTIERRTRIGRRVYETVFAHKSRYIDLYRGRYHKTRLSEKPRDVKFQGRLFGYPSCCVERFIEQPYQPNGLSPRDQEVLFHWACPSCKPTPGLVKEYRRAAAIWGNGVVSYNTSARPVRPATGKVLGKIAASLALAAGTAALAVPDYDPHYTYVTDDADRDGLSVAEEMYLGTNWHVPDTDADQTGDGKQLAADLAGSLEALVNGGWNPWINVDPYPMLGVVFCDVCGEAINMGYIDFRNTINASSIRVYYIDLHVMKKGCLTSSFRYDGSLHSGVRRWVDLGLLKRVLQTYIPGPHAIPARAEDTDGDGLTDVEEARLGTNPNGGDDGRALSNDLLDVITELPRYELDNRPYLVEHEMDGIEQCEICGANFNMGSVEIVSPRDDMSITFPYIGLHMLAHGGFAYDGTVNDGEVLPLLLKTVLMSNGSAHWVNIANDSDDDGLADAEEAFFGLNPGNGDEDATEWPDGRELAARMAAKISILPEGPLPGQTYVVHHWTRGFYSCLVCGEAIDMGYMEVVDPVAVKSVNVPYYNHHFMEHGSFSTDRDDIYPRLDPALVGDVTGITSITGIGGSPPAKPFTFVNAPNPFNPVGGTWISLAPPAGGQVRLSVYDVTGRLVRTLYDGKTPENGLRVMWDGRDNDGKEVGSGVYFCRAKFGQVGVSRKMTLIR